MGPTEQRNAATVARQVYGCALECFALGSQMARASCNDQADEMMNTRKDTTYL